MSTRDGQSAKGVVRAKAGTKPPIADYEVKRYATLLERPLPRASVEKRQENFKNFSLSGFAKGRLPAKHVSQEKERALHGVQRSVLSQPIKTPQRNELRVVSPVSSKEFSTPPSRFRGRALLGLFWLIFVLGVLVQLSAPRLKIEHGAFVIPTGSMSAGKEFHPAEIVSRARGMQELSAVLTLVGALGLAVRYRRVLVRRQNA